MWDALRALRSLARRPRVWLLPALTLALAVGGVGTLLSLFNAVMVRPLAVHEPDRLVAVYPGVGESLLGIPAATLQDLRESQSLVEDICGYLRGGADVEVRGVVTFHVTEALTGGCYRMLGVEPHVGRLFDEREAPDGGPPAPVAVIGYRFWQRAFGGDPAIVGRETVVAQGTRLTIIGVTPPDFDGIDVERAPDFTISLGLTGQLMGLPPEGMFALMAIGRLRDGATLAEARGYLPQRWTEIWNRSNPPTPGRPASPAAMPDALRVESIARGLSEQRGVYGTALSFVLTLSLLLLLLAALNVGGILLARATALEPDLAVRGMLGAGLVRLAALVAVDGVVVAIGAAAVAVPLSWWLSRLLFSTMWTRLTPTTMDVSPDAGVLAAVGGLGLLVGVLVSLPAVLLVYRRGRGAMVPGRTIVHGASRLQRGLIVGQVAVSLVLLLCAALFTRNLVTLRQIDPGYDADALRWTRLELGYGQPRAIDQVTYFRPILDQLEALPAVARAALSVSFPTTERRHVAALGAVRRAGAAPDDPGVPSDLEYASPGFFDALGVRVLEGRAFDWSDVEGREPVAVVNRTLADRLFPDGAVLGASVASSGAGQAQQARVVGIVADSSPGDVRIGALPVLYLPLFQNPRTAATPRVVLRVAPDPGLDEAVRTRIEAAGRHRVSGLETIRVQANRFFMRERVLAGLAAAFAGLSVLVSGLGLYGLLAQVALARTRESGVRAALGATPPQVASRVIREGLGPVLVGIAVGLPLAFIAARAATVLLWDLRATDPISYVAAVLVLLITAAVSCARPALRTARIAPVDALRQD